MMAPETLLAPVVPTKLRLMYCTPLVVVWQGGQARAAVDEIGDTGAGGGCGSTDQAGRRRCHWRR